MKYFIFGGYFLSFLFFCYEDLSWFSKALQKPFLSPLRTLIECLWVDISNFRILVFSCHVYFFSSGFFRHGDGVSLQRHAKKPSGTPLELLSRPVLTVFLFSFILSLSYTPMMPSALLAASAVFIALISSCVVSDLVTLISFFFFD